MRSSTFFPFLLLLITLVSYTSAQQQPDEALACYQPSCSPLITLLQDCKISVDPTTGNINFPVVANTTATIDKCLCTQQIVNAYDPCYKCGADNKKIQNRFSTQNLVDSCNVNFGALTVSPPGTSSASRGSNAIISSTMLGSLVVVISTLLML